VTDPEWIWHPVLGCVRRFFFGQHFALSDGADVLTLYVISET